MTNAYGETDAPTHIDRSTQSALAFTYYHHNLPKSDMPKVTIKLKGDRSI